MRVSGWVGGWVRGVNGGWRGCHEVRGRRWYVRRAGNRYLKGGEGGREGGRDEGARVG